MNALKLAAAVLFIVCGPTFAQAPAGPQGPTPEHKRLGYFVGTWHATGEMKPNPFVPEGEFTMTETCEWFEGGFAVVCHSQGTSHMGPSRGLAIMSYSTEKKAYTYYGIENNPMVMTTVPHGVVQGDSWVFEDESTMGGKAFKSRMTVKELSPTAYSFSMAIMGDDGAWMPVVEGKANKK
jgi:hypothetical protein